MGSGGGGVARAASSPLLRTAGGGWSYTRTSQWSFRFFLFSRNCQFDHIDTFCVNISLSTRCLHLGVSKPLYFHAAETCPLGSELIFTYLYINNNFCSGFIMHNSDFFLVFHFFMQDILSRHFQDMMKAWALSCCSLLYKQQFAMGYAVQRKSKERLFYSASKPVRLLHLEEAKCNI